MLDRSSTEARNLLVSALPHISIHPRRMPIPQVAHYENSGVLCAAYTSPVGFVAALYGTTVEFRRLANTIGNRNLARALFTMDGPEVRDFCRAHALAAYRPGAVPTLTIIEAHGSGRAASALGKRPLIPPSGWLITSSKPEEYFCRDVVNVGVNYDVENQTGFWVNCDTHEPIREMSAKEVSLYLKAKPISDDDYAVLYYTCNSQ